MARTEIPVYAINRDAFAPEPQVAGDVGNGMYFADNRGTTIVEVENSGTQPWLVEAVIFENTVDGIAVPDKSLSAVAGTILFFGPFPTRYYSQDDSSVYIEAESSDLLFRAFSVG